tara:strand:- start:3427 stop:4878 length:1452 start_codon:yes stop_codon:yes gene_type:complete
MAHYTDFVKSASSLSEAQNILSDIYNENPSHWPNGLTSQHFDGGLYLIRKSASHEPVGFVGWQERLEGMDKVGYYSIGIKPEHRRLGFAKEAVTKLLSEKSASVDVVKALVESTNKPSIALASKLDNVHTEITKSASTAEIDEVADLTPEQYIAISGGEITPEEAAALKEKLPHPVTQGLTSGMISGVGSGGLTYLLNKDVRGAGKHALAFGGAVGGGMGLLSTLLQYLENRDRKKSIDEALVNDTKEASIKKSARGKLGQLLSNLLKSPTTSQVAGGSAGAGAAHLENEYVFGENASPVAKKINYVLGALTGGKVGGKLRAQSGLPASKKESLAGILNDTGIVPKQLALFGGDQLARLTGQVGDYTSSAQERIDTELEAAKSKLEAENVRLKGNMWKDVKDYVTENPVKSSLVGGGIGASVLGAYLYNALKKPNKPKPGVMTVEIPQGEVRDRFYTNLSRNMLFKDQKKKDKDKKTLALTNS